MAVAVFAYKVYWHGTECAPPFVRGTATLFLCHSLTRSLAARLVHSLGRAFGVFRRVYSFFLLLWVCLCVWAQFDLRFLLSQFFFRCLLLISSLLYFVSDCQLHKYIVTRAFNVSHIDKLTHSHVFSIFKSKSVQATNLRRTSKKLHTHTHQLQRCWIQKIERRRKSERA